jgi:GNAT superfamily N-acetyltransferase
MMFDNNYRSMSSNLRYQLLLKGKVKEVVIDSPFGHVHGYIIRATKKKQTLVEAAREADIREVAEVAAALESRYKIRRFAYLHMITIDEEHQSKGLGGDMLRAFIRHVKRHQAQAIILRATPHYIRNFQRLYSFYFRAGFRRRDSSHPTEMEMLLENLEPAVAQTPRK